MQKWPIRVDSDDNENCKFNYTILEFIYASSVYLIFLVNFNRAYSLYDQNKASTWFGMRGTSISVALVSLYPKKEFGSSD